MRYRTLIAGLAGLALLSGCGPPVMAATNPLTYTVAVNGSWSGSWSVTQTYGSGGGYTSKSAPAVNVPADTAYTAHGDLVVKIPALPSGYQYYGSWSMSNPGMLSNAWCGNGANYVNPVFAIPASGGTITEPLSKIWGTMPATSSGVAPCDIAIQPPVIASASGSEKAQFNTLDLALGVNVVQPKPSPSPSKSKSVSPSPSPSHAVSPSTSKAKSVKVNHHVSENDSAVGDPYGRVARHRHRNESSAWTSHSYPLAVDARRHRNHSWNPRSGLVGFDFPGDECCWGLSGCATTNE